MLENKKLVIIFGIAVVTLLAGGYIYFDRIRFNEPILVNDYDTSHITQESILSYSLPETYTEEQKEQFRKLFQPWKETIERIGIESLDEGGQPLLQIGVLKYSIGDYKGAEEAWQYLYHLDPIGYLVNGNLGNLYYYYLYDYERAEKHYLEALDLIPIAPANHYTYITELFDFYRYELKDEKKAEALLERALKELDPSLAVKIRLLAAEYYIERGDRGKARGYYEEILSINPEQEGARKALEQL